MKKTIGILAHVDAGKTTLSEQILYHTGSIRSLGRVDNKTSYLDTDEIEQSRGITIFSGQGIFEYNGDTYNLIDTPGHVDFSSETERAISVLDYAILVINGSSGAQAHTTTLFHLLKTYHIPTFFFINKTDIPGFSLENILEEIKVKLTEDIIYYKVPLTSLAEFAAERDEVFLDAYLEDKYSKKSVEDSLIHLIKEEKCYPVTSGAALKGEGINWLLEVFSSLTKTDYEELEIEANFIGQVFKISHDENGNRLTFIKGLKGKLQVKDEFRFKSEGESYKEKVNEIRVYNGKKYESKNVVKAGDVFAVTGLKTPICGIHLKTGEEVTHRNHHYYLVSPLQSRITILDGTHHTKCMEILRILEAEDPILSITYHKDTDEILVNVMGKIQLEVLEEEIKRRFGIRVTFEKPKVQYKETIQSAVVGFGHFEPLRHYAEVQVRLEPNARGMGISFKSECHVDDLSLNYQRLIETHVFEKVHKGVLTGSPITDINIILQNGRAHIKHTEGGDFREATYRAIRQGLEKARSVILEPFYQFDIYISEDYLGRVMSDIQKMGGSFEAPVQLDRNVVIHGRGPVETFMEYSTDLVSFTKGTGSISLRFDRYDVCQKEEEVIEKIGYNKERDVENTSWSVFCAKGTSFTVPWNEAEKYMHTI